MKDKFQFKTASQIDKTTYDVVVKGSSCFISWINESGTIGTVEYDTDNVHKLINNGDWIICNPKKVKL